MQDPGRGNGLTPDEEFRKPQLLAECAHFVFEEHPQGLDQSFEVNDSGKSADIVVALNDRSLTDSRFNDIGIDGTLCQKVDLADLPPLILKDTDEFLADNFAFGVPDPKRL